MDVVYWRGTLDIQGASPIYKQRSKKMFTNDIKEITKDESRAICSFIAGLTEHVSAYFLCTTTYPITLSVSNYNIKIKVVSPNASALRRIKSLCDNREILFYSLGSDAKVICLEVVDWCPDCGTVRFHWPSPQQNRNAPWRKQPLCVKISKHTHSPEPA